MKIPLIHSIKISIAILNFPSESMHNLNNTLFNRRTTFRPVVLRNSSSKCFHSDGPRWTYRRPRFCLSTDLHIFRASQLLETENRLEIHRVQRRPEYTGAEDHHSAPSSSISTFANAPHLQLPNSTRSSMTPKKQHRMWILVLSCTTHHQVSKLKKSQFKNSPTVKLMNRRDCPDSLIQHHQCTQRKQKQKPTVELHTRRDGSSDGAGRDWGLCAPVEVDVNTETNLQEKARLRSIDCKHNVQGNGLKQLKLIRMPGTLIL